MCRGEKSTGVNNNINAEFPLAAPVSGSCFVRRQLAVALSVFPAACFYVNFQSAHTKKMEWKISSGKYCEKVLTLS